MILAFLALPAIRCDRCGDDFFQRGVGARPVCVRCEVWIAQMARRQEQRAATREQRLKQWAAARC